MRAMLAIVVGLGVTAALRHNSRPRMGEGREIAPARSRI